MTPEPGDVLLLLRPGVDPLAGPGVPERDPDYRLRLALKQLLRTHGLRCRAVYDADKVDVVAKGEPTTAQGCAVEPDQAASR